MEVTAKHSKRKVVPALLIIDVQNFYLGSITEHDRDIAIYFINLLIDLFRENGFPVFRIYHHNEEVGPRPDTGDFEYPDSIHIRSDDTQIIKTYSDSFNKTELGNILKGKGINTLFLCGLSAVGCVLATRTGARNNDLRAFIVKDSIMSHNSEFTRNVELMFDAVSYDIVKMVIESCSE
jgi:nicotinamidase-related amidase